MGVAPSGLTGAAASAGVAGGGLLQPPARCAEARRARAAPRAAPCRERFDMEFLRPGPRRPGTGRDDSGIMPEGHVGIEGGAFRPRHATMGRASRTMEKTRVNQPDLEDRVPIDSVGRL